MKPAIILFGDGILSNTEQLVISAIIVIVVFLLLRELWTWYWKINTIIRNQSNIENLLKEILQALKNEEVTED